MSKSIPHESTGRFRFLRYSLRTLLVLVTMFAVWFGYVANRANKQRQAVAVVRKYGGEVVHHYERMTESGMPAEPPVPQWLLKLFGQDFFFSVDSIQLLQQLQADGEIPLREMTDSEFALIAGLDSLYWISCDSGVLTDARARMLRGKRRLAMLSPPDADLSDAGLGDIGTLENLTYLHIGQTQITDAGLVHLTQLKNLQALFLLGASFGDAAGTSIGQLHNLETLGLGDVEISDAFLASISALPKLNCLVLENTRVSGVGLAGFDNLRFLTLIDSPITDAGLEVIGSLPKLERLAFPNTKLSDAGLLHLARLARLSALDLSNTQVTDAGLHALYGLPLRDVNLQGTQVTSAGAAGLERATGCKVQVDSPPGSWPMNSLPAKPRRRYLSYSLRTLLVLVTVFAVWFGYAADRAYQQRRVVELIRSYGGQLIYQHEHDSYGSTRVPTPPWAPLWLQRLVGKDYFVTLDDVRFQNPSADTTQTRPIAEMTDEEFELICRVPSLEYFLLGADFEMTDDRLRRLSRAGNLKVLHAYGPITDQGMESVSKLTGLRDLKIARNQPHEYEGPLKPRK